MDFTLVSLPYPHYMRMFLGLQMLAESLNSHTKIHESLENSASYKTDTHKVPMLINSVVLMLS